ncbi:MAG: methyltransferase domain-containing protein [Phycisphaeraceae bacterium]|nr:methyltransferase domain-containing protein [Phycisphaeraceae bacterium]
MSGLVAEAVAEQAAVAPASASSDGASKDDRLEAVAEEFNYRNRCRACRGKFWHEAFAPEQEAYASFARHKLERIAAIDPGGLRLLDIGSGFGDILYLLRDRYKELHGLDPSASMVAHAEANLRERGVRTPFAFKQGLAESLAYPSGHFDTIVTTDTYEHIDPAFRAAALDEMFRVLRPGGTLILVTPSKSRLLFWAFVDNVLTLRRQRRAGNGVRVFSPTPKAYTEVFVGGRALRRAILRAGFRVTRFERTSFYPAPERPGFLEPHMQRWAASRPKRWRRVVALCRAAQRLGFLNQKMLVAAVRPSAGGDAGEGRSR